MIDDKPELWPGVHDPSERQALLRSSRACAQAGAEYNQRIQSDSKRLMRYFPGTFRDDGSAAKFAAHVVAMRAMWAHDAGRHTETDVRAQRHHRRMEGPSRDEVLDALAEVLTGDSIGSLDHAGFLQGDGETNLRDGEFIKSMVALILYGELPKTEEPKP